MAKELITTEVARKTMARLTTIMLSDGKVTTATDRGEILDYVVKNYAAVYVDQAHPLNLCGLDQIDIPTENEEEYASRVKGKKLHRTMEAPLLLDMQTANVIKTVRDVLTPETRIKFDRASWTKVSQFCWSRVK